MVLHALAAEAEEFGRSFSNQADQMRQGWMQSAGGRVASPLPPAQGIAAPRISQALPPQLERLPPVGSEWRGGPQFPPASANPVPGDLKFPKLEESTTSPPPHEPCTDRCALPSNYFPGDFAPTPTFPCETYDPGGELNTYGGKTRIRTQRPWVELGWPMYAAGPVPEPFHWFGWTNPSVPQFLVYGDYRAATAYIDPGNADAVGKIANRLNLDMNLQLTATERVHAFVDPFTNQNTFTSVVFGDDVHFVNGLNGNFQTLFFEGDLGAMTGGWLGIDPPFDLPFTVGRIPLFFQNGIWLQDNLLGAAFTIPARNSPALDWSNFDWTFFFAEDEVTSAAFGKDDSVAHLFGTHGFIEAYGGYLEVGYAFLQDHTGQGLSYNNFGVSFQRRYFNLVSNAMRCIVNTGQDPVNGLTTADGVLFLSENVFLTDSPYYKLPYANFFLGLGRPQSVARNAGAQGVLLNTGINFESDNLTNYPTLDATGNDVYGGAVGIDLLGAGFSQQLILEGAVLEVLGDDPRRNAKGNQRALGLRYQRPLSNSWIFRCDAMHGWRDNDSNIAGARMELRHKF
jgi:hypothetical protein